MIPVPTARETVTRALVVDDPWVGMILDGSKVWEMRARATRLRGLVGLIRKGSGTVVGVVRIVGSLTPLDAVALASRRDRHGIEPDRMASALAGGWRHPWVLADAVAFASPVPYAHPRGAVVWVVLTSDVSDQVARRVLEARHR